MKYLLSLLVLITSTIATAQENPTFFIKKLKDGDVKQVFIAGEKLNVKYVDTNGMSRQINDVIDSIGQETIYMQNKSVLVKNIRSVSFHNVKRKVAGVVIAAAGVGIALAGSKTGSTGNKFDFSGITRGITTVIGVGIAAPAIILMVVIPNNYDKDKFTFHTHLPNT